jgi:hypothetical protein
MPSLSVVSFSNFVVIFHHFRALVNFLEKRIVYVEDYEELVLACDQLIMGPLSFG